MPIKNLILLAFRDFFARKGRLFLSVLGIIVGVACMLFLLSLIESVKRTVKKEIIGHIPITEMAVKPVEKKMGFSLVGDYSDFNDEILEYARGIDGVDKVFPVACLDFPVSVTGEVRIPVVGTKLTEFETYMAVYGVPREIVQDGLKDPDKYVFQPSNGVVPIVISRTALDLYNAGFAKTMEFGKLNEDVFYGMTFKIDFDVPISAKILQDGLHAYKGTALKSYQGKIVGLSNRAPLAGISVPQEYIDHWRKNYWGDYIDALNEIKKTGSEKLRLIPMASPLDWIDFRYRAFMAAVDKELEKLSKSYEYMIVRADSVEDVDRVRKTLEAKGLEVKTQKDTIESINSISLVLSLVFGTFGVIILTISAISIFNVLTMSVNEEKVDIAILRSVGARKLHVRMIYLMKAGMIGLIGAIDGVLIGYILMGVANKVLLGHLKDYPFTPASFFSPTVGIVATCFLIGMIFSLAAGIVPANYAARMKPAVVLKQG